MMDKITDPRIQGTIRHLLTSFGPLLAASGVASEAHWQIVVGIIMAGLGFWGSWTAKEKGV